MEITRRQIISLSAAAYALPAVAHSQDLTIQPITPSSMLNTRYAKMASIGPYGTPVPIESTLLSKVKVRVFLPKGNPAPVPLVFSHGELVSPQIYDRLLSHWASHGFAVFAPLHDDSVLAAGLDRARNGSKWDITAVISDPDILKARIRQCVSVIDALPNISLSGGLNLSINRTIIAGHSIGALVAQLLIGTRPVLPDGTRPDFNDDRLFGAILMSPQGAGAMGLDAESWSGVKRALIVITGNGDRDGGVVQDPNVKIDAFKLSMPDNKHLAWCASIGNAIFTGQNQPQGSPQVQVLEDLKSVTTAFLRAYGDYNAEIFTDLAGDYFTRMSSRRMTMYYR